MDQFFLGGGSVSDEIPYLTFLDKKYVKCRRNKINQKVQLLSSYLCFIHFQLFVFSLFLFHMIIIKQRAIKMPQNDINVILLFLFYAFLDNFNEFLKILHKI